MSGDALREGDLVIVVPAELADRAEWEKARALPRYGHPDAHPCPIAGCRISIEEHHKIAFGYLSELKTLRGRIEGLEHPKTAALGTEAGA